MPSEWRAEWRVRLGWLAGALVLALAHPTPASLALALPVALPGEALRLWASGHIEKTRALATGGPYAHTRNPLYLGSVLLASGAALASASVWAALAVAAYVVAFYPAVMREEAGFLSARFGAEFEAWAREVPAFLPQVRPRGPRATRFEWRRVAGNREWRTALALPLAGALLYVRGALAP